MAARNSCLLLLAAMIATGSLACGEDAAPPELASARSARKAPPAPRAPKPALEVVTADDALGLGGGEPAEPAMVYVAEGRRDPFRSFQFTAAEKPVVEAGPLADFDLSQLSVVGVVWNTTNPRALVADPGGRSFVLRQGSPIGKNNGRVVRIDDDMILVREKFVDFEGAVSTKDVEMRIRKIQGG
ncbi:MAG: pilus assembly protein PilP [Myxococcota bacterium]|nr:pilus assembly protein PilP [Myxococcota bacterium]